mgnify:CR=1 FL=1
MRKLPKSFFEEYHRLFRGDTFELCSACAGCECSLISALFPGEKEFISEKLGMKPNVFKEKFLDQIIVDDEIIEVIKMIVPCPWTSIAGECMIKEFKVVLCDIYPLVIKVKNGELRAEFDQWCPLHDNRYEHSHFKENWNKVKNLFNENIDPKFIRSIQKFEDKNYDVFKLDALRNAARDQVATLDYRDVVQCAIQISARESTIRFCTNSAMPLTA